VIRVPLTRGFVALVDDADADLVLPYKWYAARNRDVIYARRKVRIDGKQHDLGMHYAILPLQPGFVTDHRDGNGLNNQRSNLRYATLSENAMNRRMRRDNTAGAKGVVPIPGGRFRASIKVGGKYIRQDFGTVEEAAQAYAALAAEHYGSFARAS
jgi:HNH endonuclease